MINKSTVGGIHKLQKSLQIENRQSSKRQFIPFLQQRRLGKLIQQNDKDNKMSSRKLCIDDINFKNFKKIYKKQQNIQNARYSRMTRNSQQDDLIGNRSDWKVNRIRSQKILSAKNQLLSDIKQRQCCSIRIRQQKKQPPKYDKIDEQIYKKIAISKPGEHLRNPQVQTFFKHYAEVCELNENIRRIELTRKRKW